MKKIFSLVAVLALSSGVLVGETETFGFQGEKIGKLKPRLAKDIVGSSWTIGCEVLDRELAVFANYKDYLPSLGIKRIRLQGGWARCEKEKGKYDFSWIDEPVDFALKNGMTVLLETSYGNPIYEGAGGWDLGAGFPKSEEGLKAWDNWVEAMAKHFKGRVTDWAMWNEPDLKHLGSKKSPKEIAEFNVRTAKIIKRIIPEAKIAALSLAHNDPKLLTECLENMGEDTKLFHSVIYHGYSPNPDDSYAKVEDQKKVIAKIAPHLKLQQGENGAPSSFCKAYALKNIPWNELSQAKWDVRRMLGDLGHDVDSSVFTIIDYTQAKRPLNTKGLLSNTPEKKVGKAKKAYYAVQNVAAIFDSTLKRVADAKIKVVGPKSSAAFMYDSPKGQVLTFWDASSRPSEDIRFVSGEVRYHGKAFINPVVINLLTGDIYKVAKGDVVRDNSWIVFKNLIIHDFPMVIAEESMVDIEKLP